MGVYWSWSPRKTVEQCYCLDMVVLRREGFLEPGWSGKHAWRDGTGNVRFSLDFAIVNKGISLSYALNGMKMNYVISFDTTPCNYGGLRFWFLCPLSSCGKRVAKLYLPPGRLYFGCRHCHNLVYQSSREHDKRIDRLTGSPQELLEALKSDKPRERLLGVRAYLKAMNSRN